MVKVFNKDGLMYLSNLTSGDVINLLKLQINMKIEFVSPQDRTVVLDAPIYLIDRIIDKGVQKITIKEKPTGRSKIVEYAELMQMLKERFEHGVPIVGINSGTYNVKKPLLSIFTDIRKEIIGSCVFIDYTDGLFTVINKPKNNLPNALYYWEESNSLFLFDEKGPHLIYTSDKFDSIEDILC